MGTTSVDDRVKMSLLVYQDTYDDRLDFNEVEGEYSFIVGSDSHITTDPGRMDEMQEIFLEHGDLFMAHLGDIADTKAEYYMTLAESIEAGKRNYIAKYYHFIYDEETELYLSHRYFYRHISACDISSYDDVNSMDLRDMITYLQRYAMYLYIYEDIH